MRSRVSPSPTSAQLLEEGAGASSGEGGGSSRDLIEVPDLKYEDDIYDIAVVAAFGGVQIRIAGIAVLVHPVVPFFGCLVVVSIQLVLISAVALEVKQEHFFELNKVVRDKFGNKFDMHLWTDFALMFILQCMVFQELMQGLKMLVFSLCPRTWNDRPRLQGNGMVMLGFGSATWLAPLAFMASTFKCLIAYLVSTTSLSIILSMKSITEAIFNSLALTFIMDLDNKIWLMLTFMSHVKVCDPSNTEEIFTFKQWRRRRMKERSAGAKHDDFRRLLAGVIICIIFIDQITVTLAALATGWLPSARLICTLWEKFHGWGSFENDFANEEDEEGWGMIALNTTVSTCLKHGFQSWGPQKYLMVWSSHPLAWFAAVGLVLGFLFLPPLLDLVVHHVLRLMHMAAEDDAELDESDFESDSQ